MVLETIEYYKSKGNNVHVMLLDASKAFDGVEPGHLAKYNVFIHGTRNYRVL